MFMYQRSEWITKGGSGTFTVDRRESSIIMYSLDEINEALEKGKLGDVLYRRECFAQEPGLTQLAKWCSWGGSKANHD
jgi:hypothetical protein